MSFRDILETAQAIALSEKLQPTEDSIWRRYCREFSKRFSVSLTEVLGMDPEYVVTELYSDQFSTFEPEEQMEELLDILGSLKDSEYDANKERVFREEMRKMVEEEALRIKEGRPVHNSLVKKTFGEKPKPKEEKELPKYGGINMDLINKLQNDDNER